MPQHNMTVSAERKANNYYKIWLVKCYTK